MTKEAVQSTLVRVGDLSGLGSIYDVSGQLILKTDERILKVAEGWDLQARLGWKRLLPQVIFDGFNSPVKSALYVTTDRVVLIRDIDVWRETKSDMSILGIPGGVAKAADLKRLARLGAREYCELVPRKLHVSSLRRLKKLRAWLDFKLVGEDGQKYAILLSKVEGEDEETSALLESQFPR